MESKGVTFDMINKASDIMKKNQELQNQLKESNNNLSKEDLEKLKNYDNLKKQLNEKEQRLDKIKYEDKDEP